MKALASQGQGLPKQSAGSTVSLPTLADIGVSRNEAADWAKVRSVAPERRASYGELLRRARREARLTQPQLAARVGVSHSSIDGWERGAWQPTPDHLQTLRDVLGTFDGAPAEPDPLVDAIGAMSEAARAGLPPFISDVAAVRAIALAIAAAKAHNDEVARRAVEAERERLRVAVEAIPPSHDAAYWGLAGHPTIIGADDQSASYIRGAVLALLTPVPNEATE